MTMAIEASQRVIAITVAVTHVMIKRAFIDVVQTVVAAKAVRAITEISTGCVCAIGESTDGVVCAFVDIILA